MQSDGATECHPLPEVVSNGVLQGDIPTHFALPLLIIQITLVVVLTRTLAILFKPLHQPRVLAEVIGGVLLGPTALGRNKAFLHTIFPKESLTILDTVSSVGLLFYMFLVGLELDLKEIRRSSKAAFIMAFSGIALPFIAGIGVSTIIHRSFSQQANFAAFVTLMGVPMAITAFPVLARILAERKLFKTELGKVVLPAAAMNDVCAWILLAVGVALNGRSKSPAIPAYVLVCAIGYVIFLLFIVRRGLEWIARRGSEEDGAKEIFVCLAMMGVLVAGFMTDAIGIHPLFGAFAYGIMVPKEGKFAQLLVEKIEDFVTVLMLPLFFASSGLKTNLATINSARSFGFLALLVVTACFCKISATVIAAMSLKIDLRTAFAFGFLMNTKGLVELIVLNIGRDLGVFDDQTFALLVLMCLILLFITTPAVMALYKPARRQSPYVNRNMEGSNKTKKNQLRFLTCIQSTRSILGLLNLVEACRSTKKSSLKLFVMHLTELSGRMSAIMSMSRAAQSKASLLEDHNLIAMEVYARFTKTPLKLLHAISQLEDMHEDVCNMAVEKRATIVILPMNFLQREDGGIEYINPGLKRVNQRVLQCAPCSVGIYVERGLWGSTELSETASDHKVAMLFFGGPDDREALAFALRIAEHPNVRLFVMRFLYGQEGECIVDYMREHDKQCAVDEKRLDEESLALIKECKGSLKICDATYEELVYHDSPVNAAENVATSKDFSLLLIGRRSHKIFSPIEKGPMEKVSENSELGMVGDALVHGMGDLQASILVIQQYTPSFS
ncbi:hypothetical protein GOP47_0007476 [Adiantum capillus-veneris]|uniref:Cation/H+ exchanger domain-containing protein n=1 Tax=Adiantum capillus-veneris TaxID=13818 RepID=A0A9D4V281_ADICA|nr:hypothetical protein GOP47_0007476 [Adiantum capillus-veneris]